MRSINTIYTLAFVISLFLQINPLAQEVQSNDMCFNCHVHIDDKPTSPAQLYKSDVHFRKGVTCAACHGGNDAEEDMEKSMSREAGFIGVPSGSSVTRICAKCHKEQSALLSSSVHKSVINNCMTCHGIHNISSAKVRGMSIVNKCSGCHSNAGFMKRYNPGLSVDQFEKYKTSVHGQKILNGDSKVATCASCHGSHDIKNVKDPLSKVNYVNIPNTCNKCHGDAEYMKGYNIPTDQFTKYKSSVHGIALFEKGDVNAPSCNKCHGDHGASPPGVESISQVCGTCHVLNQQMFQESKHKDAFAVKGLHDCASCHNNHDITHPTDDMLGTGGSSVCIKCHKDNDKGMQMAAMMKHMIDSLVNDVEIANQNIHNAEQKGMDVSDAKFDYNDIKKVLIQARTVLHYVSDEKYIEAIDEGFKLTNNAKVTGKNAVFEYYFRRKGLGISTILISIVILALWLKIRKLDKNIKNKNKI